MKQSWIFTFGIGHLMSKYAIKINGTFDEAREKMVEQFGRKWCSQYSVREFEGDREKYFSDTTVLEV